jgi:hypothetical protein
MTEPYSSTRACDEKSIQILVCKSECKRPLRRTRRRRENNIKIALKETVYKDVGSIQLALGRIEYNEILLTR